MFVMVLLGCYYGILGGCLVAIGALALLGGLYGILGNCQALSGVLDVCIGDARLLIWHFAWFLGSCQVTGNCLEKRMAHETGWTCVNTSG